MKNSTIKPKEKTCVECGTKFMPSNSLEKTCPKYDCRCSFALKVYKKQKSAKEKIARKETKAKRIEILSPDKYRAKYLQPCINKIARMIDYEQPCIATGKFGKMAGGHFWSVGSNRTTALNLQNIHIQSYESNGKSGGDPLLYREGLKTIYGIEYLEFVEGLKNTPVLRLNKSEMTTIYARAKIIENRLSKSLEKLNPDQRIKLRNEINLELGIYDTKYCVFEK